MAHITPTIGRVVWYHPAPCTATEGFAGAATHAAIVAHVIGGGSHVNLAVFDRLGNSHPRADVPLIQENMTPPSTGDWCEWMPYQKGQAAKTEQAEARAEAIAAGTAG